MAQTIETIHRLIVHAEERGMADLARKWRDVATAESEFVRISEQSSKKGADAASSMARAYSSVLNKIDPLRSEVLRLASDTQKLTAAHDQFGASTARRQQEIQGLIASTRAYREEAKKAAQAEAEITAARAAHVAEVSQRSINTLTGVRDLQPGTARASAGVFEDQFREHDMLAAKARELKAAIDPVGHAYIILNQEQAEYRRMAELGILSTKKSAAGFSELDMALTRAQRKFDTISRGYGGDKLASTLRLTSSEMTNLGFQLNDIASGLAMGQSPFTILTQQGGQVYQILAGQGGLVNGLKAAGQWLGSLITPARVVGGLLVGAAVEGLMAWNRFAAGQVEVTRALTGVGRQSGLTRDRINEIALASAGAAEVSVASAREIATELARTGKIGAASFDGIIRSAKDYAATTGQELPAASKELADIFASPAKGADILIEKLGAMDAATRDHIGALERSGNRTQAQAILNEALTRSVAKASTVTSAWAMAWDAFTRAVSNADEALGRVLNGPGLTERIAARRQELEDLRGSFNALNDPSGARARRAAPRLQRLEKAQSDDTQTAWGEEESRASDMLRAQARDSSLRARSATRAAFPEVEQLEKLEESARDLLKTLENPGAVSNLEATRDALEGVKGQIAEIAKFGASPVDMRIGRMNEDYALQVLALQALTVEQRAAAAAEQAYAASMRDTGIAAVAVTAAEAARGLILERSRVSIEASTKANILAIADAQTEIKALAMAAPLRAEYIARQKEINRLTADGEDLLSRESKALIKSAGERAKANKQLESGTQSKEMLQRQRDQLELIEAEISVLGQSDEVRAVHIARIQAEIEVRNALSRGLVINREEYIANAEAIARASAQLAAADRRTAQRDGAERDDGPEARNILAPGGSRATRRRTPEGWSASSIADEVTAALAPTMAAISLPSAPEGTERVINNERGGDARQMFRETAEHLRNRLREAAEAADEIKRNVEDASRARFDRDASMYGDLLSRQISALQERRGRIADNDNSGSRGTPYLDPYSFKNPTRFYNPGPGGHFSENESRTERAIGAASNAQIAAIDAQIATLEAQASQLDRLAMLSSAGVDLTAQELAELQSINAAIRAGASAQAGSDFDRMLEASNRRMADELRATVEAINAGVTQAPPEANAGPYSMTSGGGATSASGALQAAGLGAYDTRTAATGATYGRGYAKGGEFSVPGQSGVDKPFIMGLAGGENVKITPANSNMGRKGRNLVQNVTINSMGSPDKVRRSTGEALREARRMGRKVAGGR